MQIGPRFDFRQCFVKATVFLSTILAIFTVFGFLEDRHWTLSLFSHFRIQYSILAVLLIIFSLIIRARASVAVNLITLTLNAYVVISTLDWVSPLTHTGSSIKILSANLNSKNKDFDAIKNLVEASDPDLIVLLETNHKWLRKLEMLKEKYPYFISEPREDNFGISVFSRLKMEN